MESYLSLRTPRRYVGKIRSTWGQTIWESHKWKTSDPFDKRVEELSSLSLMTRNLCLFSSQLRTLTFKNLRATIAHTHNIACVLCCVVLCCAYNACSLVRRCLCIMRERDGIDMQRERYTNRCVNIREHNVREWESRVAGNFSTIIDMR